MEFNLLPEGRLTTRKIMGHMALLAVLMTIILMSMVLPKVDQDRATKNRAALAACADSKGECLGGFIVWKSGKVSKIDTCSPRCRPQMIDMADVQKIPSTNAFELVDYIVLHMDDEWGDTLKEWAHQIVRSERKR